MREGITPRVSVIAAVYNTSKYLRACIDSILDQSYGDIELILVDDGSTDTSSDICREYEKKDSRVRYIRKENAGLGMARNTGIEAARGEYLFFVDSDDTVERELVGHAVACADATGACVCSYGFNTVDEDGRVISSFAPRVEKDIFSGEEILAEYVPAMLGPDIRSRDKSILIAPSAWSIIYRRELVDRANFRFVSEREIISEDVYSHLALGRYVKKAAIIREPLYNYRVTEGSLTHAYRSDRLEKNAHFYHECVKLANERAYPDVVMERIDEPYISNMIAAIKMAVGSATCYDQARERLSLMLSDDTLSRVIMTKLKQTNNKKRHVLLWCLDKKLYLAVYLLVRAKLSKRRP